MRGLSSTPRRRRQRFVLACRFLNRERLWSSLLQSPRPVFCSTSFPRAADARDQERKTDEPHSLRGRRAKHPRWAQAIALSATQPMGLHFLFGRRSRPEGTRNQAFRHRRLGSAHAGNRRHHPVEAGQGRAPRHHPDRAFRTTKRRHQHQRLGSGLFSNRSRRPSVRQQTLYSE